MHGAVPVPEPFASSYRQLGHWRDQPLIAAYETACAQFADRTAIISGSEHVSFRELGERSMRLARHLHGLGYRPGDTVVMQLPNIPEFIYLYLGLQHLGCVPLMALPAHREHEIGHYLEFVDAKAYAVASGGRFDFQTFAGDLVSRRGNAQHVFVAGPDVLPGFVSISTLLSTEPASTEADVGKVTRSIDPVEPCTFQLSGGTTGVPKVIPRTHNDYVYNTQAIAECNDIHDRSSLLVCLPIAHNFPLACPGIAGFLFAGRPVVLSTSTRPSDLFELIQLHRVTHIELVPALIIRCINDDAAASFDLSSVEVVNAGGQKFQPETKHRTEQLLFTNAKVQEIFGMAEGLLFISRLDDSDEVRWETVGRPVSASDEVVIVDDDGKPVAVGEMGEMICRGPYTLRGYFRAEEYNQRAFTADGFFKTGDLMRLRADGNYIVEGRKKDLVNRGGEKISAEEIEDALLTHDRIRNVAVVSMPDAVLGERMCVFLVVESGVELAVEDLSKHLASRGVATYKHPERVEIVADFPLSPFGKVQKNVLATRIAEMISSETLSERTSP